jgi:hypothetical protein
VLQHHPPTKLLAGSKSGDVPSVPSILETWILGMSIPGPDPDRSLRLSVHFHSDGLINPVPAFFFFVASFFFFFKFYQIFPFSKEFAKNRKKIQKNKKSPCFLQIDQASSQDIKGF